MGGYGTQSGMLERARNPSSNCLGGGMKLQPLILLETLNKCPVAARNSSSQYQATMCLT